jgi:hypothetical protein
VEGRQDFLTVAACGVAVAIGRSAAAPCGLQLSAVMQPLRQRLRPIAGGELIARIPKPRNPRFGSRANFGLPAALLLTAFSIYTWRVRAIAAERDAPVLIAVETVFNGLGAQTLRLMDALAFADSLHGRLVVHRAKYWNYGCAPHAGWNCYFHPPASISALSPISNADYFRAFFPTPAEYVSSDIDAGEYFDENTNKTSKILRIYRENCTEIDQLSRLDFLDPGTCLLVSTPASALRAADHILNFRASDELAQARALARRIWRLRPNTRYRIDAMLVDAGVAAGLSYIGVHVRRGDKGKEVPFVPLSTYATAINAIAPAADTPIFLASDDASVASLLAVLLPARVILTLTASASPAIAGGHDQLKHNKGALKRNRARVEALLAEIDALSAADAFVGSFSSNLGRLVHVLRRANANTTISVDDRWGPGVAFRTFGMPYCDAQDANTRYCELQGLL